MKTGLFISVLAIILGCAQNESTECEADYSEFETAETQKTEPFKKVTLSATDGLTVTADIYDTGNAEAPWIILCHQAGFSRGEYREIAPQLNALGYNCIATDQRSGNEVNGIKNETNAAAKKAKLPTAYSDAIPDVEAALKYVNVEMKASKVILWGSSYSAALTFVMAAKHPEQIDAIVAFSPGEYFKVDGKGIAEFSANVTCPVFISSAKSEHSSWKGIFEKVTTPKSSHLPEVKGIHGSRGLWESTEGNEAVWEALKSYLKTL